MLLSSEIIEGARRTTPNVVAIRIQAKARPALAKIAARSATGRSISIGTNETSIVLIITWFSVSIGPIATAKASARACVPSR